jgi:hypothetical protein
MSPQNRFSGLVTVFHERRLPERGTPAGYAALIDAYDLHVPLPRTLSAIGEHHRLIEADGWRIYTPRHAPKATLDAQLTFALKYEGLDLAPHQPGDRRGTDRRHVKAPDRELHLWHMVLYGG